MFFWNIQFSSPTVSVLFTKKTAFPVFDIQINWIKASLCDGEDEKSEELQAALEAFNGNKEMCLKIRASVENIVYSLHRVDKMRTKMPEIFSATIEEDEV